MSAKQMPSFSEIIDVELTNVNAAAAEVGFDAVSAASADGATLQKQKAPYFSRVKMALSAFLILAAGAFLLLGVTKMYRLELRLQQMPLQLQQQLQHQMRLHEQSHAAKSRRRRSGERKEESIQDVMVRKDVIYVVSDISRTVGGTGFEGRDSFPARFLDLKWRLSEETPSIPQNAALPRSGSSARRFGRRSSTNDAANQGAFAFDPYSGIVTVHENGLYFIFSQVTFYSLAPRMEFSIQVNGDTSVTCKNEQQISISACDGYEGLNRARCLSSKNLLNSCNTGGLRLLEKGDQVEVSSSKPQQQAVVGSKYSFFGILKV